MLKVASIHLIKAVSTGLLSLMLIFFSKKIFAQKPKKQIIKKAMPYRMATLPSLDGLTKQMAVRQPVFKADTFDIKNFGAINDGIANNAIAINAAIDACNQTGGGVVKISQGLWLTGPIALKSNVNLYLEKNALVQFSGNFDDFPLVKSSFEGVDAYRCQSPIWASNQTNIAITGSGIFNGNGNLWRPVKKGKITESDWKKLVAGGGILSTDKTNWYSSPKALKGATDQNIGKIIEGKPLADYEEIKDFLRPNMLRIFQCNQVLVQGVTFENSPAWTLHFLLSENLSVLGVKVKNPAYGQNTDAIDLESCKNALLEDNVFDTGDDGICIKSGRDEEGRKRGKPTENVIVNHCTIYHAHGGFVVGSEMSGGAKNLFVSNCSFIGTDIGLRFKTKRGRGGIVQNVYMSHITMRDIVGEAILFDMYYDAKDPILLSGEKAATPVVEILPVTEATPKFQDFYIKDVVCLGAEKAIFIRGLPEMSVKNIHIENCVLQAKQGMYCEEAENIFLKNVKLLPQNTNPVFTLLHSINVEVDGLVFPKQTSTLFEILGAKTNHILLKNTSTVNALKEVIFKNEALTSSFIKKD